MASTEKNGSGLLSHFYPSLALYDSNASTQNTSDKVSLKYSSSTGTSILTLDKQLNVPSIVCSTSFTAPSITTTDDLTVNDDCTVTAALRVGGPTTLGEIASLPTKNVFGCVSS